jgi:hypothetical protein
VLLICFFRNTNERYSFLNHCIAGWNRNNAGINCPLNFGYIAFSHPAVQSTYMVENISVKVNYTHRNYALLGRGITLRFSGERTHLGFTLITATLNRVRCKRLFDAAIELTRTLLDDLAQGLIDSRRIRKDLGNIGLQDDDICAFSVLLRIFSNHRVAEIVLIQHLNFFILFLAHNLFSHVMLPFWRL